MSGHLQLEPRIAAPDDFYEALIEAHRGLSDAQSQALNARLILLLANHIGDLDVLREALAFARERPRTGLCCTAFLLSLINRSVNE
jgi:hypothetical protein